MGEEAGWWESQHSVERGRPGSGGWWGCRGGGSSIGSIHVCIGGLKK